MKSIKRPQTVKLELEDLSGYYDWHEDTKTEQYINRLENLVECLEFEVDRLIESINHIERRTINNKAIYIISDFITFLDLPSDIVEPSFIQVKLYEHLRKKGFKNEH